MHESKILYNKQNELPKKGEPVVGMHFSMSLHNLSGPHSIWVLHCSPIPFLKIYFLYWHCFWTLFFEILAYRRCYWCIAIEWFTISSRWTWWRWASKTWLWSGRWIARFLRKEELNKNFNINTQYYPIVTLHWWIATRDLEAGYKNKITLIINPCNLNSIRQVSAAKTFFWWKI